MNQIIFLQIIIKDFQRDLIVMVDIKLLEKIRKLANDEDWKVREDAASEIEKINDKHFEEYYPVWKDWVRDPEPNIRRSVEVGLLRINKKYVNESLELLEPLLYDSDNYVRKNCGPFALSAVCSKDPDLAFKQLKKWMKIDDVNVRWNVAMCLGVRFGLPFPEESLKLLKILAKDKRKFVWRAAASSLIKMLRKHPKYKHDVYSWKNIDQVLEVVKKYVEK